MAHFEHPISSLGPLGDGIIHHPTGRVFVDRALPGDKVRVALRRDSKGVLRGELQKIVSPSPFRRDAPCPHYASCGNCTTQHMDPAYYSQWKTQLVRDALERQGVRARQWKPTVFLPAGSRRRATFTAVRERNRDGGRNPRPGRSPGSGRVVLGYYARRSRQVAPISDCLLASPRILELRRALESFLGELVPRHSPLDCFVQTAGDSAELLLTGAVGARGVPSHADTALLGGLAVAARLNRVSWRPTPEAAPKVLFQAGSLIAQCGELAVELPPGAFRQPTPEGEKVLVDAALAAIGQGGTLVDLFAGCGTFSGPLLAKGQVDAFELCPRSVQALNRAASGRTLRAACRNLFSKPLDKQELSRYDAAVVDPPRAGCAEQARVLAGSRIPVVVYVSCNPATFARDARILSGGYRLQSVQTVDQFLWSHHVEMVGIFHKKNH